MGLLMLNGIPYSGFTEPSNIYSTTEREVGVWIDGKPLYEKTYNGSTPNSNTCQISDVDSTKIIHNAYGRLYFANSSIEIGSYLNASYYSGWYQDFTNNGILDIFYSNDYKNANYEITIQYTKTSDAPGSGKYAPDGSVMHHYSTDEHVIGTWVDGKTLYEKTIKYVSDANSSDTDVIIDSTIRHGINCAVIYYEGVNGYGYMDGYRMNNTTSPEPLGQIMHLPYYGGGTCYAPYIYFYNDGIHFMKNSQSEAAKSISLTVKYIKLTN